eukprot:1158300-Pelagomonas_calceolata.AAC.1
MLLHHSGGMADSVIVVQAFMQGIARSAQIEQHDFQVECGNLSSAAGRVSPPACLPSAHIRADTQFRFLGHTARDQRCSMPTTSQLCCPFTHADGPVEFLFVGESEADPAWPCLRSLAAQQQHLQARGGDQSAGSRTVRLHVSGLSQRCSQKIHK